MPVYYTFEGGWKIIVKEFNKLLKAVEREEQLRSMEAVEKDNPALEPTKTTEPKPNTE